MKVMFATTWDVRCGIATYSHALVAELRKHAEVEVVSLDPGVPRSPARLAAKLNEGDVAHIQHEYPFFGGMRFYRNTFRRTVVKLNVPLVVTVHEIDLHHSPAWDRRAYKRWFNRRLFLGDEIDRMIVHTEEYRLRLEGLGVRPEIIRVIPEGIAKVEQAGVTSDEAKAELGLAGKRTVMVYGFVVRRKGYATAVEALSKLPRDVTLIIAGGGHPRQGRSYEDVVLGMAESAGLSDRVLMTGYLPDERVPLVMAASDIVIAPYVDISSSGSILRAIAYGKPIVASDVPATREINERKECLALVPRKDPDALAAKITELLENQWMREALIQGAKAYAEKCGVEYTAAQTLAVYKELLA